MIIYVVNRAFPHKTFVTTAKPKEKVARIRAQLLHTLYELGKDEHLFRLRFKGQILRDSFTFEDYDIRDNSVVTMVPVGKSREHLMEIRSIASGDLTIDQGPAQPIDVKTALEKEIKTFDNRERMVADYKVLLFVHFMFGFLSVLTIHWYSVFWLIVFWAMGSWFVPTYSRIGGFVGNNSHLKVHYCIGALIILMLCLIVSMYFCISGWIFVTADECKHWVDDGHCSHRKIYTSVFFTLHCVVLILTFILSVFLFKNIQIKVGDFIEKFLVQERDVDMVMKMAKYGKIKEKRSAAYDLAAMAASSDDNKFRIVAEGGMEVLMTLALSRDEMTQEHAVEALAEILTIPSIQDTFVEIGGVRTLTAVLHSPRPRVMQEAAVALYSIVADSEENKQAVVDDHGIEDLCHAAHEGTIFCQRTVASIFLELAFNSYIRSQLASRNTAAQALVHLCKSNDPDTQQFALQALEVLAIECPEFICAQEDLIGILLNFPYRSMDPKLYLLAGKILLYFAENIETCQQLLSYPRARDSLELFAKTQDPVLQKVTVKIIYCSIDQPQLKEKAKSLSMLDVIEYIKDFAADRDTWEMADQCYRDLSSDSNLSELPSLSTLEKLNRMQQKTDLNFGSSSSLSPRDRNGSHSSGSSSDIKKGLP